MKLFGKRIPVPADDESSVSNQYLDHHEEEIDNYKQQNQDEMDKESIAEKVAEISEGSENNDESLQESNANPKTPSTNEGDGKSKTAKTEKERRDSEEKALQKPDKITPCPRCNSMDTKFCYYNNYNVSQPRHFCKACQRYWTSGGTMRNVPVGAGRRKNKNFVSHYRPITISEAIQAGRINNPNPTLDRNVRILSFGIDAPTCASGLFVGDITRESGDDCSSSCTVSNSIEERGKNNAQELPLPRNMNGLPIPTPYPTCVSWPYQWNSAPPGFPMTFYPPAYWNVPGAWSLPWLSPQSPSSTQTSPSSAGSNSPTLGKHSRESDTHKPKTRNILVPKTLRIDDPNEAAKSSIWTTLGIKNESMFKAFQPESEEKTSSVYRANPAALSRSLNFHESS